MPLSQPVLEGATPWFRIFLLPICPVGPHLALRHAASRLAEAKRGLAPRARYAHKPKRKRSTEPKTFKGLTHKPPCVLCEQETGETNLPPPVRPAPMPLATDHPRTMDTSMHFCPHSHCDYRGWLGQNNLRANGDGQT